MVCKMWKAYGQRRWALWKNLLRSNLYLGLWVLGRAGKNRFESIRIDSVRRIEWVIFDSVQFDYTIHISDIAMFCNWQPIL